MREAPEPATEPATGRPPAALVVGVGIALLEALALLVVAAVYLVALAREGTVDIVFALLTAVLALGLAAGLAFSARALWRGSRWGRGPVITWQLLQVPLLQPAFGGPFTVGAVVGMAAAVVAVIALLLPSAQQVTSGDEAPPLT